VVAATLLGKESELGTIAPGAYADLVGMKEDPLKDITATERVSFVMKEGVVVVHPGAESARVEKDTASSRNSRARTGFETPERRGASAVPASGDGSVKTLVKMIVVVSALSSLAMAAEVDRRENRQQERIGQGVQSGQLTPGETARLEQPEQRIDNQVKAERAANGGHLTAAERAQVNREQNRESRRIYAAKHNARHQ
jgi:hypothetical protein